MRVFCEGGVSTGLEIDIEQDFLYRLIELVRQRKTKTRIEIEVAVGWRTFFLDVSKIDRNRTFPQVA